MLKVVSLFSLINNDFKTEEGDVLIIPSLYGDVTMSTNFSGVYYAPIIIIKRNSEI